MQSACGFVCLSVYPGMAENFAQVAWPGKPVKVYAVTVFLRELRADKDQLRNQRLFAGREVGDTVVESLVFGHGARIKGSIPLYKIREYKP